MKEKNRTFFIKGVLTSVFRILVKETKEKRFVLKRAFLRLLKVCLYLVL